MDNVEVETVEESQRGEGKLMVWRNREGKASFYSRARCCGSVDEVVHGDGVWSCEGARECAREVADILAILVSVTARRKVV